MKLMDVDVRSSQIASVLHDDDRDISSFVDFVDVVATLGATVRCVTSKRPKKQVCSRISLGSL